MFLILQVYNSKALSDNAMVNELQVGAIKAVIDSHQKWCWKKGISKSYICWKRKCLVCSQWFSTCVSCLACSVNKVHIPPLPNSWPLASNLVKKKLNFFSVMEYVYVHILENRLVMYKAFYFNQTKTLLYSSVSQKIVFWQSPETISWHDMTSNRRDNMCVDNKSMCWV